MRNIISLCVLLLLPVLVSSAAGQEISNASESSKSKPRRTKNPENLSNRGECGISSSVVNRLQNIKCPFNGTEHNLLRNRVHELRCCAKTTAKFENNYALGGAYLQTYLEKLKLWNCTELHRICDQNTFSKFSKYSELVQTYFCNISAFHETCSKEVSSELGFPENTTWDQALNGVYSSNFSTESLTQPCIQIATYHSKSGGYGFFHESVTVFIPFCDVSWCGLDSKTIEDREISTWFCIPSSCRISIILACVTCALLALAIVLANITVIAVFTTSPKLRNSQAVYKISLAIADLLVGLFVIPSFISSLIILYQSPFNMGAELKDASENGEGTVPRSPADIQRLRFPPQYIDFVGFFTILSIMVSINTLMMASCDRFMAIYQPLRYGRHNAKHFATWASLTIWIVAIFVSALPFLMSNMEYGIVASILVATVGTEGLVTYGVLLVLPLLLVWTTTIATYISTAKQARRRQNLTVRRSNSGGSTINSLESRLAKTLSTMVGVFTLCLLPPLIVVIVPFFLTDIYDYCIDKFNPYSGKVYISIEFVSILLLMTNSLWNCFIYNSKSQDFKSTAKRLYGMFFGKIGARYVWGRTRVWATSTMRSGRTTTTTVPGKRSLHKKSSKISLRTMSNEPCNGSTHAPTPNGIHTNHSNSQRKKLEMQQSMANTQNKDRGVLNGSYESPMHVNHQPIQKVIEESNDNVENFT